MENVLVTGGAGFVGSHLVEYLVHQGYRTTVLDNFADSEASNLSAVQGRCDIVDGDVRDERIASRIGPIDAIFHFAANANVPRSTAEPMHDASTNVLGTVNMLNLAKARGARFVLASSGAVYGEPVHPPMAEAHPLLPISPYGASKLAAEGYVGLYKRLYGLEATIVRLFNMYGPRQRRYVVYDFAHKILAPGDEIVVLGSGRQIRSLLYVGDAVRAVLTITTTGTEPVYNVGSASSIDVTALMSEMLTVFGASKKPTMTQVSWQGDVQRLVPDVTKLHQLGFQEQVTLQEGLTRFKEWFLTEYGAVTTSGK
jgi:UDP-glucose 4-epimerase